MTRLSLFLLASLAFAQQASAPAPAPIQLTQPEAMELALIRSQMQTLQTQLENLRLRACMRVSATDCSGWSPDGAAVILRQPPKSAPIGTTDKPAPPPH